MFRYGGGCCCRPMAPVAPVAPVAPIYGGAGVGIIAIAILILIAFRSYLLNSKKFQ